MKIDIETLKDSFDLGYESFKTSRERGECKINCVNPPSIPRSHSPEWECILKPNKTI